MRSKLTRAPTAGGRLAGVVCRPSTRTEGKGGKVSGRLSKYHQPFGLSADILFSGYDRAKVEKYEGIGDSATWTGHYLAALAFRYAVTADTNTIADIRRAFGRL